MKMFSDCSGPCVVCSAFGGGCLAGHGDDDFVPATAEVLRQRLRDPKYKFSEQDARAIRAYILMAGEEP